MLAAVCVAETLELKRAATWRDFNACFVVTDNVIHGYCYSCVRVVIC